MMPLDGGTFQYLGASVDTALGQFVASTSARLCAALAAPFATSLAVWVVLHGWAVLRGDVREPIHHFVVAIVRMAVIGALALGVGAYQQTVSMAVGALADDLASILSGDASGVLGALDLVNEGGIEIAIGFFRRGEELLPISGYSDILVGFLILIAHALMLCVLGGYILLAKVALALMLAVGPLFIASTLFAQTTPFFESWLGQVISYVLLMAMMAALAGMVLQIHGHYLATVASHDIDTLNAIEQLAEVLLISGAMLVVSIQVPQIAGRLGGGVSLKSGSQLLSSAAGQIMIYTRVDGVGLASAIDKVLDNFDRVTAPVQLRYFNSSFYRYKSRMLERLAGRLTRNP
jgi:type IV secretion system protein VirB6